MVSLCDYFKRQPKHGHNSRVQVFGLGVLPCVPAGTVYQCARCVGFARGEKG